MMEKTKRKIGRILQTMHHFTKKNIPFLYFGVADHKDYHQPTDDFENIQPKFYMEAVNNIISIFKKIDRLGL